MDNFIGLECKSCGNRDTFKRKGRDYICGCCGRVFFEKQSDEAIQCEIAYNALKQYRFDEAKEIFEGIFARKHPNSIDARWGYLLAEYRVVYVKGFYNDVIEPIYCYDKYEMQKTRCFTNEVEYTQILDLLKDDNDIRLSYKKKAEKIDDAIASFRRCKGSADNDVFICVKISAATESNPEKEGRTKEFEWAERLYSDLKKRGKRPFFSFHTLKNNVDSDHLIWTNLVKSKKMVLIGSREDYIESAWVKSEWKRWLFLDRMKDFYILALPEGRQSAFDILPKELGDYQHYTADRYGDLLDDLCAKEEAGNVSAGYVYDPEYEKYKKEKQRQEEARRKAEEEAERKKREEKERREREAAARKARDLAKQQQREADQKRIEAESQKLSREEEARQQRANADIARRKAEIDSLDLTNAEDLKKYKNKLKELEAAIEKENREREAALRKAKEAKAELRKSKFQRSIKGIISSIFIVILTVCILIILPLIVTPFGYQINSDFTCEITWLKDDDNVTEIDIPDKISIFKVTSIADQAFDGCDLLTSVTIPDSVKSIGYAAFYNCPNLKSVTMGGGIEIIEADAFKSCYSLTDITIPDSVTSIGEGAFYGCSGLTSITIPDSVTSIDLSAFGNCIGLTSITIPDGVTSIYDHAFYGFTSLTSITIPDSVTSIGEWAFRDCTSLTSITIPDGVTSIGKMAFLDCTSLTNVTIGDGVTSIGYCTFDGCTSLTSITIPDSVTSIDMYAFRDCIGLASVTIGNGVTSIDTGAFEGCNSLTSITIPDSVTSIEWSAFYNCTSLASITIGNGVTSVGDYAFYNFEGKNNCLTSVTIGNSVTSIGYSAFRDCIGLTSITIPNSVTSIANSAFYNCKSLTSINYNGRIAEWNAIEKGSHWNTYTPNYTIYCTDGTIYK